MPEEKAAPKTVNAVASSFMGVLVTPLAVDILGPPPTSDALREVPLDPGENPGTRWQRVRNNYLQDLLLIKSELVISDSADIEILKGLEPFFLKFMGSMPVFYTQTRGWVCAAFPRTGDHGIYRANYIGLTPWRLDGGPEAGLMCLDPSKVDTMVAQYQERRRRQGLAIPEYIATHPLGPHGQDIKKT